MHLRIEKKSHLVRFGIIRPKCRDKNGIRDEDITATVPATRTVFKNWFIRLYISPVFVLYTLFQQIFKFGKLSCELVNIKLRLEPRIGLSKEKSSYLIIFRKMSYHPNYISVVLR